METSYLPAEEWAWYQLLAQGSRSQSLLRFGFFTVFLHAKEVNIAPLFLILFWNLWVCNKTDWQKKGQALRAGFQWAAALLPAAPLAPAAVPRTEGQCPRDACWGSPAQEAGGSCPHTWSLGQVSTGRNLVLHTCPSALDTDWDVWFYRADRPAGHGMPKNQHHCIKS